MQDAQVIVLATPVFLGLIAIELLVARRRGLATYAWADTLNSIGLGMLSQLVGVLTKLFTFGIYVAVYERAALFALDARSPWVWIGALLAYDFLYYWLHRAGHAVALFWAAHVVHHQSEEYNLSTALRQTGSGWLAGWVFYMPMAVAGVPPLVFAVVALVDLLYQFWVHTRLVDRLGWFDRWFCAPSNHRVHHAVNDVYLDRNYGGILVVWDRLFGTFQAERADTPCVYGTRSPLRSWNPLWANLEVYAGLVHDSLRTRRLADKCRVWLEPPGWRPADVAAQFPRAPFVLGAIPRYAPPMSPAQRWGATTLFTGAIAATCAVLWNAHRLDPLPLVAATAGVLGLLWAVGWVCARQEKVSGLQT
jgi:sterol desaturase/sphingolipid hydroxylase (fatty acid hydroxylase superfamily)